MPNAEAAVKERPILFSGPMVRAILAGRKTQTRRIIHPQPSFIESSARWCWPLPRAAQRPGCSTDVVTASREWYEYLPSGCCPYGEPGDRLWVRESLRGVIDTTITGGESMPIATYAADGAHIWTEEEAREPWIWQRSSLPSIHMPRRLCRIVLEVTAKRAEQLHEITEAEAVREGAEDGGCLNCGNSSLRIGGCGCDDPSPSYRDAFASLWHTINGEDSWHANPWVWVMSFKRIEVPAL